jgi:ABC-type sugar transport system substrate-binding protein
MEMKTIVRKLILVLLVSCIVTAGVFAGGQQGGAKAGDQIVIGVAMQDVAGMTRYMVTGMREYLKTNAPNVRITVVTAENDASKQQEQVQMFVTQGVNAIVLNPVDMKMSVAAVDIAARANIPVITLNTVSENKSVKAHVGSDDREAGRLQMERLILASKEKGPANPRMAYVNAALGHSAQVLREEAYKEVLGKHPEVKLIVEGTANWYADQAQVLVENWLQKYPGEIDAIAAQSDYMLQGVVTAVRNAGLAGKILLAGMDCDTTIMGYIQQGIVDDSIWQDFIGQGEWALRLAIDAAQGKPVSDHMIPYEVCTSANVDGYIQQLKNNDALMKQYY